MLLRLSTGLRFRFAIALAAFAALCFVLPPAVLAVGHGANTADCLSHAGSPSHAAAAAIHAANDVDGAHHGGHTDTASPEDHHPASSHKMTCCGLFCLGAILVSDDGSVVWPVLGVPHTVLPKPRLLVCAPIRPERPPNTSLFA